jgi:hypothetical protein
MYLDNRKENHSMIVADDKLPEDVIRKEYSETRHTLCCRECGFEASFDPTQSGAIGRPLYALLEHRCTRDGD